MGSSIYCIFFEHLKTSLQLIPVTFLHGKVAYSFFLRKSFPDQCVSILHDKPCREVWKRRFVKVESKSETRFSWQVFLNLVRKPITHQYSKSGNVHAFL